MSVDQNKETVRRYFEEAMNTGNPACLHELFDDDYGPASGAAGALRGPARAKHAVDLFRGSFPDVRFEVTDLVAEGDEVAVRVIFEGTHTGTFMGIPPTGKHVHVSGVELARLRDGKVVEEVWHLYDELHLLRQLGVVAGAPHGR